MTTTPHARSTRNLRLHTAGLTALAAALLACGAPSSSGGPETGYASCPDVTPATCPTPPPSWATDVQPIIERRCALGGQCHGAGGAEQSQFDYTTYAGVEKNHGRHWRASTGVLPHAPLQRHLAPTDAERTTLLTWFVCGAPDN